MFLKVFVPSISQLLFCPWGALEPIVGAQSFTCGHQPQQHCNYGLEIHHPTPTVSKLPPSVDPVQRVKKKLGKRTHILRGEQSPSSYTVLQ